MTSWLALVVMGTAGVGIYRMWMWWKGRSIAVDTSCVDPQCVRCRNYRGLEVRVLRGLARMKLDTTCDDLQRQRLQRAVVESRQQRHTGAQRPTVLFLPWLRSSPFPSDSIHAQARRIFSTRATCAAIHEEYRKARARDTGQWKYNSASGEGKWRVLHLINQGRWQPVADACPVTSRALKSVPLVEGVFGNAFFSELDNDTKILPHYGPTNVRHRLHLPLELPGTAELHCHGQIRKWEQGNPLIFDDSYLHAAVHLDSTGNGPRVVFIVDLWHPMLTEWERATIGQLYAL